MGALIQVQSAAKEAPKVVDKVRVADSSCLKVYLSVHAVLSVLSVFRTSS